MRPLINIILPVYNVEKYIAKCIQSILNQTYDDFELLVIDDGSPDNSIEIAKQFNDPRIQIYHKDNGGLSDARNYGLERANGKYIYFMDSDDWIEPDLLDNCLKVLEKENLDLVIFGYIQDDEDVIGNVIHSSSKVPSANTYIKYDKNINIDSHILGLLGYAWNKIYRLDFLILNDFKFEKGTSLIEDILFNTLVYCKTDTLRMMDKAFYHYINRPVNSLIKQYHENSFDLQVRRKEALKSFFEVWRVSQVNQNEILSYSTVTGIRYCIHNLFSFKNSLSFSQKIQNIRKMVYDRATTTVIKFYDPKSFKDIVFKILIQNKNHRIIALLAYLVK